MQQTRVCRHLQRDCQRRRPGAIECDTIICIGTRFTDTITAGFTRHLRGKTNRVLFAVRVGDHWFSGVPMDKALAALTALPPAGGGVGYASGRGAGGRGGR